MAKSKNINLIHPIPGDTYNLGEGNFTILAPNSSGYNRINDYSIVIKYVYKNNSFFYLQEMQRNIQKWKY